MTTKWIILFCIVLLFLYSPLIYLGVKIGERIEYIQSSNELNDPTNDTTTGSNSDDNNELSESDNSIVIRNSDVLYSENLDTLKKVNPSIEGSFVVKEGVKVIDIMAFAGCNRLTTIKLPLSLKRILKQAFVDCSNLEKIELPDSLQYIGAFAFEECKKISQISIPKSTISINDNPFIGCNIKIIVPESHKCFLIKDSYLIDKRQNKIISYLGAQTIIIIPRNIRAIGAFSFAKNKRITTINMGKSNVEEIGNCAFECCSNVNSIIFPDSLKKIDVLNPFVDIHYNIDSEIKINANYAVDRNGFLFDTRNRTIISYLGISPNINIDFTYDSIGGYAFAKCEFIKNVKNSAKLPPEDLLGCSEIIDKFKQNNQ